MKKIIRPGEAVKEANTGRASVPSHSGSTPLWYTGCWLLLTIILIFCLNGFIFARQSDPILNSTSDSSGGSLPLVSKVRKFAATELYNRRNEFTDNQVKQSQTKSFLFLRDEVERTAGLLKQGYGSDNIYLEIGQLIGLRKLAGEGVTSNKDKFQTVRNLTTTSILLKEILDRTNNRSREVLAYHKILGRLQFRLDSLLTDTTLYLVQGDSAAIVSYFQKLTLLSKEIEPVRIPLRKALDSVQKIEVMVNQLKYGIESDIAETESQRETISGNFGLIETGASGHYIQSVRTFNEIVRYSIVKAALVLTFYVVNHASILLLMVLLIAGIAFYLFMLRRKSKFSRSFDTMGSQEQLFAYPIASAILIGLTIFQFFLPLPPFALSGLMWLISGIALTVIIRKSVTPFWYKAWLVIFILFLLGYTGNLLLWQSPLEGWTMFFFISAGLSTGIFLLLKRNRAEITKKLLLV